MEIAATDRAAAEQLDTLEAYVRAQFEPATRLADATAKRDAFWSISDEILQNSTQLVSPQSQAMLGALGRSDLFWKASWPWSDHARSRVGPARPARVSSLDAAARAYHELQLFNVALATVDHVLWETASREFAVTRPAYSSALDGDYPWHWLDGTPAVLTIQRDADADHAFLDAIAPFVDATLSADARIALYDENVYARRMTEADLLQPEEAPLIGQWGAFAKRRLPANTCVGVYGGLLLERKSLIELPDRRWLAKVTAADGPEYFVSGENRMSLMNSRFIFDERGDVIAQDNGAYDIRPRAFRCRTADGTVIAPIALFTEREIEADTELRWDYSYDDVALVRNKLRG